MCWRRAYIFSTDFSCHCQEITSQKLFFFFPSKGRTGAQTSEGSLIQPELIHYTCCICLLLRGTEPPPPPQTPSSANYLQTPFSWIFPEQPLHLPHSLLNTLPLLGWHASLRWVSQTNWICRINTRFELCSRIFIWIWPVLAWINNMTSALGSVQS